MFRILSAPLQKTLSQKNPPIIVLLGLRQTGKTTLAKTVCSSFRYQLFNFDLPSDRQEFISQNRHTLAAFAERYRHTILLIDEVQKCPEAIGIIKHLYDQYHCSFLLTGSSELKIKHHLTDTLAGRTVHYRLYPLTLTEQLVQQKNITETQKPTYDMAQNHLPSSLVYGSLPGLMNINPSEQSAFLHDFIETLLSKDVLEVGSLTNSTKLFALARLVALQIGQLVNMNELALLTELTRTTVYHYLDILEQLNIICRASPLSTNTREAISTKTKIYFTDNGIRNALIGNMDPIQSRLDTGALLENAVYMGIKRSLEYARIPTGYAMGFFRNSAGSEVDIVVKKEKKEYLYEVKTAKKYRNKKGTVTYITMENAWEYLL